MKKLPIGIQDFVGIREDGFHYVDKTAIIYPLLTGGKTFFLSRPRRFGKSLLCSTLGAIWEGKRELFQDLAINTLDWHWEKHPVIRIDLNAGNFEAGTDELLVLIHSMLNRSADKYQIKLAESKPGDMLGNLIIQLHNKTGKKVAVIIDEYDKPLLSTITNE